LVGFDADYVLADKGYDSDRFVSVIIAQQARPVILRKKIQKNQEILIKPCIKNETWLSGYFKVKNFRRIATRYERLAITYQGMLSLVACMLAV